MPTKITTLLTGLIFIFSISLAQQSKNISEKEVLLSMKKATKYMVEEISLNGGFLWYYKKDLSERFGEIPARKSQIWLQAYGTTAMGQMFLNLYQTTGDEDYLDFAKKAASAIIYGQHPLGGWHYFIDFDKKGLDAWYQDTASQFIVGWEEFRHYYGNCTFDDDVTQGVTKFLIRLYSITFEPSILTPLKKALEFILTAQYPNGGWPQRYPLRYEFAHDGFPDYTSYYTLNDGAMNNIIDVLLDAYELLGDERYLMAAKKGADFFMLAQGPEGHAGWTDQYNMNLQPSAGRTHEPASFQVRYTLSTIKELEKMFLYTGDRRYLRPIPMALDWLENSAIDINKKGQPVYAKWYDPETNYPLKKEFTPEFTPEGYMKYQFTVDSSVNFVSIPFIIKERKQYEQIRDVEKGKEAELYTLLFNQKKKNSYPGEKEIKKLINTMDEKGAWIESFTVHDISRTMDPNYKSVKQHGAYQYAVKTMDGISTRTYMKNMQIFIDYLKTL